MSHIWRSGNGELVIAAKGAPEAVLDLCHCSPDSRVAIIRFATEMAEEGLRVLGVARAPFMGESFPASQRDFDFQFLGLVGLADPIRPSVQAAVAKCVSAGIRVIMITGDYPATASAIARQAGLEAEVVLTGDEMEKLSDAALADRLRGCMCSPGSCRSRNFGS